MTLSLFRILMPSYWKDIKRRERDSFPGSLFRFQFVFWKEKKLLRLYFNITEKLRVKQYYIGSVFLYILMILHLILKRRDRVSSASVRKKKHCKPVCHQRRVFWWVRLWLETGFLILKDRFLNLNRQGHVLTHRKTRLPYFHLYFFPHKWWTRVK